MPVAELEREAAPDLQKIPTNLYDFDPSVEAPLLSVVMPEDVELPAKAEDGRSEPPVTSG